MPKKKSFESDLTELQAIATQMEKGDMSLEASLKSFEKGLKLARSCQHALTEAELKIEQLVDEDGELFAEALDDDLAAELLPDDEDEDEFLWTDEDDEEDEDEDEEDDD
ncbi:MAG: exodeoxyribonuclease VII small subunit [Legionellales bacterium]|nr:exodeoxyribonuclease VII small subunit [Legionellales bacterium]|tara:strand:- start:116 stop:442 length:327 start_codon:yes stop_codon:yes gene_type:complete